MRKITVGSFNLRNLANPNFNFYPGQRYSETSYQKKIIWTAQQLDLMDCDVVGFQEIFQREALEKVIGKTRYYHPAELITIGATGEGPVVGLLSRLPVKASTVIADFPARARLHFEHGSLPVTSFSRPILKVELQLPTGHPVKVFVAHLKSKRPDIVDEADPHDFYERSLGKARSLIRRAAEGVAFRYLLLNELIHSQTAVIAVGDFNDSATAVTTEIISGSPPLRFLPHEIKKKIWDVLLYNVKDEQIRRSTRDVYYTHIHNGHYESLDHILVSQEFLKANNDGLGWVEYVKVLNDHLIDDTLSSEKIPEWKSDHGQVVATIVLKEND